MYNYPKKYLYEIMQIIACTDHNYIRPFGRLLQEEGSPPGHSGITYVFHPARNTSFFSLPPATKSFRRVVRSENLQDNYVTVRFTCSAVK